MFHLTLSPNITNIFEGFCILKRCDENVKCLYSFPDNYSFKEYYDFIFPCDCPKEKSEEYCIVRSNASNDRSFLLCRYIDVYQIYICIYSLNPWFEILSKVLLNISHEDFMPNKFNRINSYLKEVNKLTKNGYIVLPPCNANDNIPQVILKGTRNYPYIYDKYIQEYLTAIDPSSDYKKKLWLEIFWSMLLERPIIFMSKRYQKLTSSLLAATFFIHPLSWLHKFISIIPKKNPQLLGMNCCMLGIHSCMEPMIEKIDFWYEALLVDLDKGVSTMVGASDNKKETDSRFKIPKYIRKFFVKHIDLVDESVSCNTHSKIEGLISNTPWYMNENEIMYNVYKKGFHMYSLLFRTLISMLIGNYRQFIHCSKGRYEFDRERFIIYNPKLSAFLKIFVQSQCFDSFIDDKVKCIEFGYEMDDRFDRERLEFSFINNVKCKNRKSFRIRPLTGYHLKNSNTIDRIEKVKTMPNLKKKGQKKVATSSFQLVTSSLSSSISSINSYPSQECLNDDISVKSASFNDEIIKGPLNKSALPDLDIINNLSVISSNTAEEEDDILLTPINCKNSKFQIQPDSKPSITNDQKPSRPLVLRREVTQGKVLNIVSQINHFKLEDSFANSSIDKPFMKIKPAAVPLNNKVVSKSSYFDHKPVIK